MQGMRSKWAWDVEQNGKQNARDLTYEAQYRCHKMKEACYLSSSFSSSFIPFVCRPDAENKARLAPKPESCKSARGSQNISMYLRISSSPTPPHRSTPSKLRNAKTTRTQTTESQTHTLLIHELPNLNYKMKHTRRLASYGSDVNVCEEGPSPF